MAHIEATRFLYAAAKARSEDELLNELASLSSLVSESDSCDIMFRDSSEGLVLRASTVVPELVHRLKLGKGIGLSGMALSDGCSVFIGTDAFKHPRYAKYPGLDESDSGSVAAIPLRAPDGLVFGVILYRRTRPTDFTPKRKRDLEEIAELVSLTFKVFRSGFQVGNQSNRLGALSEVTRTISSSPYLEEVLQLLVHLTAQQFNYKVCTVRLLDQARNELVLRATQATVKAYQRKRAIRIGESYAGRAIETGQTIIVRDVQIADEYIGHDLAREQGLRSMICVPLAIGGKAIGVLSCYTEEVRDFTTDEIRALETLAKQAALSIENAKLQVRDTLMQEMHHRVKNNLQQVASLLRLQMRAANYKSLEEALNDILTRILAISAVHDLLSREDLDHVGLRSIAETLVHHQHSSLILPNKNIQFVVRGEEVRLNMTQATQIALVLNELISNAVEHGFASADEGEIHVTVEEKNEEVSLWVSNNGDSLPANFDLSGTNSLGLQIVTSLTRTMGGRFKMSDVLGWTVAEVKFPRQGAE